MTPINMIGDIPLMHYLITASALFVIAVYGMLSNRRSIISILMAIELMLLAININFVAFSVYLQDITGQIFVIFILTIAAAEAAIGLAILVTFFRNKGNIEVNDMNQMRG